MKPEYYVPLLPKPSGLHSAIVQVVNELAGKLDPRSSHFWAYNLREYIPSDLQASFTDIDATLIAPVRFPGISCSWVFDGSSFEGFRQLRPGTVLSEKALRLFDPLSDPSLPYDAPKGVEIMDPETVASYDYFTPAVNAAVLARRSRRHLLSHA